MLIKTEALVLKKTPYGENSAVVIVFSQSHGVLSFIFSSVQGKNGKSALIRPGVFLEMVFNHSPRQNLLRAKEIKAVEPFMSDDFIRSNLALVCTELVKNTLPEAMPDENLFLSLKTDFARLYRTSETDVWFLHRFMLKLCDAAGHSLQEQGFNPNIHTSLNAIFAGENSLKTLQLLLSIKRRTATEHCAASWQKKSFCI